MALGPGGFGRGGPGGRSAPPALGGAGGAGPGAAARRAAALGRGGRRGRRAGRGGPGGFGGLLGSPTPSTQVVALLQRDAGDFTWAAAAVGSNTAAGYQLATQLPVMAVGGFNGTDPAPTLAQFQELVAAKKIHWFVGGGAGSAQVTERRERRRRRDRRVGAAALHPDDRRRHDPVRPVRSGVVSTPVASTAGAQVEHKDPTARADIVVTMSVDTAPNPERIRPRTGPVLDVVVPVYNEEADLEPSVRRLHAYLSAEFPYPFRITIADNASVDATPAIATGLAAQLPEVESLRMPEKGRGRALRAAWTASDAQVLAYCDVDLSTDLAALLPLVAPLISGHSDLAIGTRLARDSRVVRGAKREFISRSYNLILRGTLAARFSDAQCGFKAIRGDVAQRLVPLVEDTGWFFDTELLVLAERAGLRIHEVPVDWVDDPDSSVDIVRTALDDLKGIARLGRALATGRVPLQDLRAKLGRGALAHPGTGGGGRAPRDDRTAGPVRGGRGGQHAGLPAALRAAADGPRRVRREPGGARRHRRGQHRRQPAADLRRARP